jgi:hypothetical protein
LESGVDNCYPGLEFDQRNLDTAFFPGLKFEFHHEGGAKLKYVSDNGIPSQSGLRQQDCEQAGDLYLWGLIGKTSLDSDVSVKEFVNLRGLRVWRIVHDLLPGLIAVLIAPKAPDGPDVMPVSMAAVSSERFMNAYKNGENFVERDRKGNVKVAVLIGNRARYLDDNGVIEIDVYNPGDLTKTLCSPWQYDFRECGCFYWAANKPDLVSSKDGSNPNLNFLRKKRNVEQTDLDITDIQNWYEHEEYEHNDLIEGAWNDLPIVIDNKEQEQEQEQEQDAESEAQ